MKNNQLECEKTILDFQNGCNKAYERLYIKYHKPITFFVSKKIYCKSSAQDIVQEIFFKVYKYKSDYQTDFPFSCWVWTIAKNTVFDSLRKTQRTPRIESGVNEEIRCLKPNPEILLQEVLANEEVNKILGQLNELQKKVLTLRAIQQLSYKEISVECGMTVPAIKSLIHRARITLNKDVTNSFDASLSII